MKEPHKGTPAGEVSFYDFVKVTNEPKLLSGSCEFHAGCSENPGDRVIRARRFSVSVFRDKHKEMIPNSHALNFGRVENVQNRKDSGEWSGKDFHVSASCKIEKGVTGQP